MGERKRTDYYQGREHVPFLAIVLLVVSRCIISQGTAAILLRSFFEGGAYIYLRESDSCHLPVSTRFTPILLTYYMVSPSSIPTLRSRDTSAAPLGTRDGFALINPYVC